MLKIDAISASDNDDDNDDNDDNDDDSESFLWLANNKLEFMIDVMIWSSDIYSVLSSFNDGIIFTRLIDDCMYDWTITCGDSNTKWIKNDIDESLANDGDDDDDEEEEEGNGRW